MAKKRRKSTSKKKKSNNGSVDMAIVSFLMLGILLLVLIYAETGALGEILSPALGGIVGVIKYVIPLGFIGISISLLKSDKAYVTSKICQYIVFLSCISAMISIFQVSKGNLNINMEFSDCLQRAYELGTKNVGGGTVGTAIAYPLIRLLGMFGAAIVTTGIAIIMLVFTFGFKPAEFIVEILYELDAKKEEKAEELQALREERMEKNRRQARVEMEQNKKLSNKEKKKKLSNLYEVEDDNEEINEEQITINLNNEPKKEVKTKAKVKEENAEKVKFNIFNKNLKIEEDVPQNQIQGSPKEQMNPNEIEGNLFVQKAPEKEEVVKEVLQLEHNTIVAEDENYETPPVELLKQGESKGLKGGKKALTDTATKLQKTLYSFGVSAKVENVSVGPAITRYELKPAEGVRVNKIANLADDIALNLAAESIRIEAPIPGKQAVGIEIPNKEKEVVHLRDIIESPEFMSSSSKVSFGLGKDVAGETVVTDIGKMPHMLIAGSTGSGKSVCINTLITSIIYKAKPSEVKLVMVDPKVVELSVYNGIPHLLIPVVTDPRKAAGALAWAVQEMENRYQLFANKGVRDLKGYNEAVEDEEIGKLPQIVIIIDELADLMMVAAKEVEDSICRLAQKARAAGMHLVIATQRPSVDVITGIIKANIPSRIAFAVSSQIDSRTILDMAGAEKLLGKGDMLFYPIGSSKPVRVQGAFVSDKEVEKIVDFLKSNGGEVTYNEDIIESIENANKSDKELAEPDEDDDTDPFLEDAIRTVVEVGQASTSFIQRRFKVGYARAGRIIDQMEARGIISGYEGSKPRQVLMSMEKLQELSMSQPANVGESNGEG